MCFFIPVPFWTPASFGLSVF
jgi:hypothetical protein